MKLLALRGISCSGKSTYCETLRNQGWAVVSRDNIRETVFKDYDSVDENAVTAIEDHMIDTLLKAGRNTVIDDTNIRQSYLKRFAAIATKHNADFDIKQFDIDVKDAIQRQKFRTLAGGRTVPEGVIRKQAQSLKSSKINMSELFSENAGGEQYVKPGKNHRAVLVDIDGTIAHNNGHRSFYEWDKVGDDEVVQVIVDLVHTLWSDGLEVVIMSGRDEVCREETIKWLDKHDIKWDALFMRPEGDQRKDSIVKIELFDNYVRDWYDVEFVLDDRPSVCRAWRSIGLTVLQCGNPDIEF